MRIEPFCCKSLDDHRDKSQVASATLIIFERQIHFFGNDQIENIY